MQIKSRLLYARWFASRHLLVSAAVAALSAGLVFGFWYPAPFRSLLEVGAIFLLVLTVDVVCGPLLTLILCTPSKSVRERLLDFVIIGAIQLTALGYGLHSVWVARPVVMAFESDRIIVVTANEIDAEQLGNAPEGLRRLPFFGVMQVGTRRAANSDEFFQSINMSAAGVSPAMRPGWWVSWAQARPAMAERAKPVAELMGRRLQDVAKLEAAIRACGVPQAELRYLPLTSSKTKDWVALLDSEMKIVGWAPVDGFD